MRSTAVVNASPLILLSRGGHCDLLHLVADEIVVPAQVAGEVRARGTTDPTAAFLASTPWISVLPEVPVPPTIIAWGLGAGESAVLAHALANPGMEAIIDDLAGRRCAEVLGIPVRGTLGVVLLAKRKGLITSARATLDDLLKTGLYLSRQTIDAALKRVGE